MTKTSFLAVVALLAGGLSAAATEIPAGSGQSVSLGGVSGTAYYVRQADGLKVVATLSRPGETAPVRFETVLADGQRVKLSAPRQAGASAVSVEIVRNGDAVALIRQSETVEVASAIEAE